ncbi:DUF2069 domain-containing protein [Pseudoteredinibacter isoporae]|uniref:DUF2069 domain-containing protein n=1 Tax=Pseudoteredinibacter isoporae TaxID=570281 RepID=UPI00310A0E27
MSENTVKEVKRIPNLENKLQWGMRLHWLCYGTLIVLYSWLNLTHEHGAWGVWGFQVVPLLLPLWSMLKGNHKAFSWFCFIILFYFTAAVVSVAMPPEHVQAYHWLQLILSTILFFTGMMCSRWIQYHKYWQQQDTQDAPAQA